ncbi:spore protein [Bacillus sp. FJAT-27231]|uniref:H-type small acid-soluble spore protein n=1 Tax=Bacillus sp. FJAT-27231 TaxID=1679168 RepID=UPI000670CFEA|nr:H-type small acid-soluble spore protein [Bacillus sp. FJAT-27231]KMY53261.1 spore protein [Bacillus sp. FJAT-27231]
MKMERVLEILQSEKDIPVHYKGVPIWIEGIDKNSCLATIQARGTHDESRVVSIDGLEER